MKKPKENAVIYARYSSHNQHETSIEGQLSAAHVYADKKGYTVIKEYCDRAKTGTNDNREAFQQMLYDTSKKQFTVIIVWKVDRFGRNRNEITFNKFLCKKNGVRIEYVAEHISEGPEGILMESILEGMAEYFSVQLSQNVQRGLLEAAKKHHVIGGQIALGYRMAPDKTYEINPDEAPYVKKIFEMYAEGHTESEITSYLNTIGLRTRRGVAFNRSSLKTLLKNERYIGVYTFKNIIRDEDAIPAIVDKETFYKVQDMLKQNKKMPSHKWSYSDYLLTGKLHCGECGGDMVGKSGKSHTGEKHCYYCCLTKQNKKSCSKKNIRQDKIEPFILEQIHAVLDDDTLEVIADKVWDFFVRDYEESAEIKALHSQLQEAEKALGNLYKALEGGLDTPTIHERIAIREKQKADIEQALAEIELSKINMTRDHILFFLTKYRDMDLTDRKCQKRMVDAFVNAIYLWDDHVSIALNYTGENNTITIEDIKETTAGFDCGRISRAIRPTEEPCIYIAPYVIILDAKIPL